MADPARYAQSLSVPWKRVVLHFLRPGQSLNSVLRSVGWSKATAQWRSRRPLRITLIEAAALADSVRAPRTIFLRHLLAELGVPPAELRPAKAPPARIRPRRAGRPKAGTDAA